MSMSIIAAPWAAKRASGPITTIIVRLPAPIIGRLPVLA
jgi:hypothetical protein